MREMFEEENLNNMKKVAPKIATHFGDKEKKFSVTTASLLRYLKMNEITFRKNGKENTFSWELCQKMVNHAGEMLGKVDRVEEEFDDSDEEVNEDNIKEYLIKKRDTALELGLVGQYNAPEVVKNGDSDEENKDFELEKDDFFEFMKTDKKFHFQQMKKLKLDEL